MSKGHVFLAQNSNVDYVRQAAALAFSIKKHNKRFNQTCIITNDAVPNEYRGAFDYIVPIPWRDSAAESSWKIENRWKIIHASPFKENIVYDADMILLNSNDHWWQYFENKELVLSSNVTDYRGNIITSDFYRKTFTANSLDNVYVGVFYFKKSVMAYDFFEWLKLITENWEDFYSKYLPESSQKFFSVDVSAALAVKFMGCPEKLIATNSRIPSFIHMKPAIQGWENVPRKWTDILDWTMDDAGRVKIGNYQQQGVLHYVEEEFLTDDILFKLMK